MRREMTDAEFGRALDREMDRRLDEYLQQQENDEHLAERGFKNMKTPAEQFCDCIGIDAEKLMGRAATFFQRNTTPCEVYTTAQLEEWNRIHNQLRDKRNLTLAQAKDLDPEDVFDSEDLYKWAREVGIECLFPKREIEKWALANGFVRCEK